MELQEKIKAAALEFIGNNYGETEEDACYCVDALASHIAASLEKPEAEKKPEKELVVIRKVEEGTCPYCGGTDIRYDPLELSEVGQIYYPAHCNGCKRDFEEWYDVNFTGHNVGDGLDIDAVEGKAIEMEATEKNLEPGRRIMCSHMKDDPRPIPDGTIGTINHIDDAGQIHVDWDNGRTLALVPDVDEYTLM